MGARMASLLKLLIKNAPCTIFLMAVMVALDAISEGMGVRQAWRDSCGFMPEKLATYITHAFLHRDLLHVGNNLLSFFIFGAPVEMRYGRVWYVCSIMLTAICGASLTAVALPDYWPSDENPVGFSIVAYSLSGGRRVCNCVVHLEVRLAGALAMGFKQNCGFLCINASPSIVANVGQFIFNHTVHLLMVCSAGITQNQGLPHTNASPSIDTGCVLRCGLSNADEYLSRAVQH